MRLGIALLLLGVLMIFLGTIVTFLEAFKERGNVEYAGFIFIGPFPVGIASSKEMAYAALFFSLIFLLFLFLFLR